jgi:uncharacterized protein (TIGR02453 family)
MAATPPLSPSLFRFLKDLARHNDRVWFQANKERYHSDVRDPLLRFIADFAPKLAGLSRFMVADPSPNGGSLFRIHRDTRFARDKTPYKTHAGMTFRHVDGQDVHGPIFYLHLEPGSVFVAAGIWQPPGDTLKRVRDAIVAQPAQWKKVTRSLPIDGARLSRPPRGYDPDHPLIEDLKLKSFTTSFELSERDALAPGFLGAFTERCERAAPLVKFLSGALGLAF